jgi:hypothetical protein
MGPFEDPHAWSQGNRYDPLSRYGSGFTGSFFFVPISASWLTQWAACEVRAMPCISSDHLQDQKRFAGTPQVVMPEFQTNVGLEPFAPSVHAGRFVDAFGMPALLDCVGKFLDRLLQTLLARKAVPDLLLMETHVRDHS